ncbi:SGNH/GDSL hydrolase family protein [Paenibacillus barcinonensis]|uniref:GDSL-like lipase/acylhydrolase family protein n=1 Tax=Paenibacillus barcinonensis TaxID=198119 RepID=A0A2V4V9W4_PAEBA|nr:SGNH/GDSL hydrolase family protein [Paenibacillus barcinonensis]PYE48861.1 GDSL-like lipase/acylhydrolase family protein [Paenibacillus barcinonensis]QKS57722.1 SGNH/GDSL hydrolase family protein [Paenibacillus barcinonensis]
MTKHSNEELQTIAMSDLAHLKIHGRTTANRTPVTLFWTGSAVELNVQGAELWVEVESAYDHLEPWIRIVINGVPVSRQMLTSGRGWLCIFRGLNPEAVKNVRIIKDVQAMSGDPGCLLQLHAVRTEGVMLPVEEKPYRIEFIGDSITSGEGAIGAKTEEDWVPMWFSALHNYTYMTAEALDAEYRVISQSGWGVLSSWDNNPQGNIPAYYEQVCGLLKGERNEKLGAFEPHDFSSWQPDVIVVNLGSNDDGAFHSPAWTDPVTGQVYKQRLNEDGTYHEADLAKFEQAVERFLATLRTNNPCAQIVWAYGMLGATMLPAIYRAVHGYIKQTGDRLVSIIQLPDTTEEMMGARTHPGELSHRRAAEVLTAYIRKILK